MKRVIGLVLALLAAAFFCVAAGCDGDGEKTPEPQSSAGVPEGGVCRAAAVCLEGLICRDGTCQRTPTAPESPGGSGGAEPPVGYGLPCSDLIPCESGLVCTSGVCRYAAGGRAHDATCSVDGECSAGTCRDGHCRLPAGSVAAGGACVEDECASGLTCSGGICVPPPAPDTTPPTVRSTNPAMSAIDVPVGATITITFSEPVLCSSVNPPAPALSAFQIFSYLDLIRRVATPLSGTTICTGESSSGITFTPSAPLTRGMMYSMCVSCDGNITDTAVLPNYMSRRAFSFLAERRRWQGAVDIGETVSPTPSIAIDAAGNAMAVWRQTPTTIVARRYDAVARSWSSAATLSDGVMTIRGGPLAAVDADGNVVVLRIGVPGIGGGLVSARTFSGGSWGTTRAITTTGNAKLPALAIAPDGREFTATWVDSNPTVGDAVVVSWCVVGAACWTGPATISTPFPGVTTDVQPAVAINTNGDVVVAWEYGGKLRTRAFFSSGGDSGEVTIDTRAGTHTSPIKAAIAPSGNAVVVWSKELTGSFSRIWSSFYSAASGTWSSLPILVDEGGRTAGDALDLVLSSNEMGGVLVAWDQDDGATLNVWGRATSNLSSGTWGRPIRISDDTGSGLTQGMPSLAYFPFNPLVVWTKGSTEWDVVAERLFYETEEIISGAPRATVPPATSLAMAPNGRAVVVWAQTVGGTGHVFANFLE